MEPNVGPRRRGRSLAGPVILISLGLLFLLFNFVPDFDPWPALARYWPLILILGGLGRLWDYYRARQHPDAPRPAVSGVAVAWILLFVLLVAGSWHGRSRHGHFIGILGGRPGDFSGKMQDTKAVDLGGAKSVSASLEMPSGMLTISGADSPGGSRLLDADFHFDREANRPKVDYQVSGDHGELNVTEGESSNHTHIVGVGRDDNDWNLKFGGGAPLDLKIELGAGESDVRLNGLEVSNLKMDMGAGEMNLDLTGARKSNLDGNIQGGAGTATIRLPKDVGVRVQASGGIGTISAPGLTREGDVYTNAVYGKTPASIELVVEGGVGTINLDIEP